LKIDIEMAKAQASEQVYINPQITYETNDINVTFIFNVSNPIGLSLGMPLTTISQVQLLESSTIKDGYK